MEKQVFIIGAGAIGRALAVFLQLNGRKVVLLRGSVDDGERYTETIRVVLEKQSIAAEIAVDSISNFERLDGIVVITAKSFGNEKLAARLAGKTGNSPLVLLQNGLGVEEAFSGFPELYRCVLFVTSQVLENGEVRFKPVAPCPIGTIRGDAGLAAIVEALSTDFFSFVLEPAIQPVIWKKAIVNSVFNSVCPLLDLDNGIFHRDADAWQLAKKIVLECLLVAAASGIDLSEAEVLDSLLRISRFSDGQLISTLQDIRLGRQTEIDTLNFAIVRIAESLHMGHLVPETKLLGEMTLLKANLNLKHAKI
jgi:2-dehydropantoate 2-reductase